MWTPATRGRMAEIEKKTKRYPTDLTDEEWARIEPFLPGAAKSGRPARTDLREVLNAIRYLARSGGGWRMLPKDFPPWPKRLLPCCRLPQSRARKARSLVRL